jgi:hypothetical protein
MDVGRDVSAAPGGVLPLTSNLLASIYPVDNASGTLGLGLAQIFLPRLNRRWTAFIRCRLTSSAAVQSAWLIFYIIVGIVIIIVIKSSSLSLSISCPSGTSIFLFM